MLRDRRSEERIVLYRAEIPGEAAPHEVQYESVADAFHFACRDLHSGRRTPVEITESGIVVYDAERIRVECEQKQVEIETRLEMPEADLEPR